MDRPYPGGARRVDDPTTLPIGATMSHVVSGAPIGPLHLGQWSCDCAILLGSVTLDLGSGTRPSPRTRPRGDSARPAVAYTTHKSHFGPSETGLHEFKRTHPPRWPGRTPDDAGDRSAPG